MSDNGLIIIVKGMREGREGEIKEGKERGEEIQEDKKRMEELNKYEKVKNTKFERVFVVIILLLFFSF